MPVQPLTPIPPQTEIFVTEADTVTQSWWDWFNDISRHVTVTTTDHLSITADYTVVNGDAAKSIYITGTSMGTVTFTAPSSGYAIGHTNTVYNKSSRRWNIAISGQQTQWLWPGQSITVSNEGTLWAFSQLPLWAGPDGPYGAGPTTVTLYVDPAGSDNNDGLVVGAPLEKIQTALHIATFRFSVGTTIKLSTGTHTPPTGAVDVLIRTGPAVGKPSNVISIVGDDSAGAGNRGLYILQTGNGGSCVNVQDQAILGITGCTFQSNGSGSVGISARQQAVIDVVDCDVGQFLNGTQISATTQATINILGTAGGVWMNIRGSATSHLSVSAGGVIFYGSGLINIPNPLAFTQFVAATTCGIINGGNTITGAGAINGSSGKQYIVNLNAVLISNGTLWPGTIVGTPAYGGTLPSDFGGQASA